MTTINPHPTHAHTSRSRNTIEPRYFEAALDWCDHIHCQDGVLKLANLLQDLAEHSSPKQSCTS
jgi:hypothetical protein